MNYFGVEFSEEHKPVTWWRGHPIYAAHLIVVVFVASMLVTTLLLLARAGYVLNWLEFSSGAVWRGQIWRVLTYGLVNSPVGAGNMPNLGFVIDMLMIVWFGREVERTFGLRRFFLLYGGIYLIKPLFFTALGPWISRSFSGEVGSFALFVAFATLHPNAPLLFNILAKWAALVLVGISTLMALAMRDWVTLFEMGSTCGYAFAFVRQQQGLLGLPRLRWPSRRPRLRVLPDLKPEKPAPAPSAHSMADVDALLDKIARSGIRSLTPAERARLEAARTDLLKRDRKGS